MTSKVLGIDLHDAGRDGVYRMSPDDPATLIDDARRAGLMLLRTDLSRCHDQAGAIRQLAGTFGFPANPDTSLDKVARHLGELDWLPAPGYVLLLDHAQSMRAQMHDDFRALCKMLAGVAKGWHQRAVPFFVFMEFPDHETLAAAIDA